MESTQYFQFDSQGNMFIFTSGDECLGQAKLAKPGDDFIFSSENDWQKLDGPWLEFLTENHDTGLAFTCPSQATAYSGHEYNTLPPNNVLIQLTHKNFSKETMKKIRWVRKIYNEWHAYRHANGFEYITCDIEDPSTITEESLIFAMCSFITEVKKLNGEEFLG